MESRQGKKEGALETYLSGDYRDDLQELDTLDRTLSLAVATFRETFSGDQWPYDFHTEPTPPPRSSMSGFSQGTAAMALSATGKLLGECQPAALPLYRDAELKKHWDTSAKALRADLRKCKESFRGSGPAYVRSSSFGNNNAMTASHLAELMNTLPTTHTLGGEIRNRLQPLLTDFQLALSTSGSRSTLVDAPPNRGVYQGNAFVPLRALKTCLWMNVRAPFADLRSDFESSLHDQLSFSAIPDSRFDPAELLFCLEGLLLCAPNAVDEPLFDRVLAVLAEKQATSAHWRPNKPFLASDRGAIFLALSVEGANSLIRSADIMDRERRHDLFASKCVPLLRRFWGWLVARSLRFTVNESHCVGWHSEHVNAPGLIHLWDTSQVVEFILGYRSMLSRHIAHRTLELSGVRVRRPKPLTDSLPPRADGKPHTWQDVIADREPLVGEDKDEQIYTEVDRYFIAPRSATPRGKPAYSMLLYGPPGTGKSTLAKLLADALAWPMITVTVSDFLGSGGAMVEARAKAIFQMLEAQADAVILFDEIDAFLLDRDSKFYREQETLFKFLTPGMLTKINDLRSAAKSIFVIATNYANRIDPAIKRIGRIDRKLLLLPPNLERRKLMITKAIKAANDERPDGKKLNEPKDDAVADAAKKADYLGWNDIKAALDRSIGGRTVNMALMARTLKEAERSTGPSFYGRRYPAERPFQDEILRETTWLCRIATDEDGFESEFLAAVEEAADGPDLQSKNVRDDAEKMLKSIKPKPKAVS